MFSQSIGAEDYETFGDDLSQGVPLPTIIIIVLGVYLLLVLIVVAGKQPKHKESFELWPINYIESFCNLMDWSIKDPPTHTHVNGDNGLLWSFLSINISSTESI